MPRRATGSWIALFVAIAACGGSAGSGDAIHVIRASATHGLPPFALGASGSSGYALDLQYIPAPRLVEVSSVEGRRVVVHKRDGIPYSTDTLVRTLRCKGGQSVTRRGDELTISVESEQVVRLFRYLCAFDLGPFELASQDADVLTLRSRNDGPIDEIQIVSVPPEDEWRRLMARDIDVIPTATGVERAEFDGVSSVRTISLPRITIAMLVFDMRSKLLEQASLRRAIMEAIDRQAIAKLVCRECGDDVEPGPASDEAAAAVAEDVDLPAALELLSPDVEPFPTIAAHIQYTLARRGVDVTTRVLEPTALMGRLERPYQLALVPHPTGTAVLTWYREYNLGHWQSPEFDKAMSEGDMAAARAVVGRELPGFDIVTLDMFAAVDAHLCGGNPTSPNSWGWLADLHPCEADER